MKKLFVIKKYIWAESASKALREERRQEADDCWIDEDWKKAQDYKTKHIDFNHEKK